MNPENIKPLVEQLEKMVLSVTTDRKINNSELRRVLRFVSKVVQVVNQAFQNIYPILIEIKFLEEKDLRSSKIYEILKELELLSSRDYYRDVKLICGQLNELGNQYKDQIGPIINNLHGETQNSFEHVFMLLEHHEGYILAIIEKITWELKNELETINGADSLDAIRKKASQEADDIKDALNELQVISNKILGISGKDGFLELTETDRLQITDEITYSFSYIDKSIRTGNISGNQVAIGSDIHQSYHHEENSGMNVKDIQGILDTLINEVKLEGFAKEIEEKVIKQLEVSKDELTEEDPDKDYIGKNLQKAADTMKKAGNFIDQSTSIGKKILEIGKWIGAVILLI